MRERHLSFSRSRRRPAEAEPDPSALEAQVRAAFPRPAVPDALRARVAESCRTAACAEPGERRAGLRAAWGRRHWTRAARWGSLGLAAVAVTAVWLSGWRQVRLSNGSRTPLVVAAAPATVATVPAPGTPAHGPAAGEGIFLDGNLTQDHDEGQPASRPSLEPVGGALARGFIGGFTVPAAKKASPLTALQESRPDRYLIRNATLTLEVRDARQAARALIAGVGAARGYVAESHESVDDLGQRSVVIKVRVPFGRFDGSLQQIEALGKVLDKQVTADDVTEEFVDSQARLRNLEETEERLRSHLHQTARLADILLVENALTQTRGQIEQLEGRLRYLAHRIAYSTLSVTLSEAPRPQPVVPPAGFSSGKVAADAMRALVACGQVLWSGAIWLAVWAVVWVPLGVLGWVALRRRAWDDGVL